MGVMDMFYPDYVPTQAEIVEYVDEIERRLAERARAELRRRGVKVIPAHIGLWGSMLLLAPLGDWFAQVQLAYSLREPEPPRPPDVPWEAVIFDNRRFITVLFAALAAHPDYAAADHSQTIRGWSAADTAPAESKRLVDWYCATHPMHRYFGSSAT